MAVTIYSLSLSDQDWDRCVVEAEDPLTFELPEIGQLLNALRAMHEIVPMRSVLVLATTLPVTYTLQAADGRVWAQTFLERAMNAPMTFAVSDGWRLTEFEPHRPLRLTVERLLVEHKLTKLDVHWRGQP